MIQRFIFLILLIVASLFATLSIASAEGNHKPPPITIVLYLESQGPSGETAQPLLDLRDRLRGNDRLEALVFEPDSPTFILAARNANPPISLDSVTTFDTRIALAQAVGAQFALMAAPTDIGSDHMDLRLFEVQPISRSWSFVNLKAKDAAKAVADQVISAASEKAPAGAAPPAPATESTNPPGETPPVQVVVPPAETAPTPTPASPPAQSTASTPAPTPAPVIQKAPAQTPANATPPPVITAPPAPATPIPTSPPAETSQPQETPAAGAKTPGDETLSTESPLAAPPPGPALDNAAIGTMNEGDTALQQSDVYGAIQFYREAVNEAPRAAQPRMRLIQAYLQAGLKDQALDEERRALMLDPNNTDLQNMLKSQSADGSLPGADLAIRQAAIARDPNDENAWIALGDSYWNSGQPDQALLAYEKAARIKPGDVSAQAHLARLYAATSQYDKSLDALTKAGPQGYPYALRIIAARTDSLIADIESAHESFAKGESTREAFYDSLKKADQQSQALADFVGKITPPAEYNVAYLHRRLATNLLAQATAEWLSYIETNEDQFSQQADLLQTEAAREMKTASIAERLQSSLSAVSH